MQKIDAIKREILRKITPTQAEKAKMEALARHLELKVSAECMELGVECVVRTEGSLAKDTWLKGDPDVDVFMRFPPSVPRMQLGEVALKIARRATAGSRQVERFAEHPYLEAFVDGTRVNIVPCYAAKPGEWLSATDRTPYHTDYINTHLKEAQRRDVRLLKKFMKGIGVYGAEIRVGGFSGYLCELLVLHCGSFQKVLESFANHQRRRVVDIAGFFGGRQRELELLFAEPLVVVDPVDRARNVASAVQPQKLHLFAAASREFLREPTNEFFEPLKTQPLTVEELGVTLRSRGSALVFLAFSKPNAVADVLWGQLHRTRKALQKQLELADFKVLRADVWSEDESETAVFVFELEQQVLSATRLHLGPPLEFQKECDAFLAKYGDGEAVSGPFIDGGRWAVLLPRKFTNAAQMLTAKLGSGGRDVGVAELVAKTLRENFQVLVGEEIAHYAYDAGFAVFLTDFLAGKPFWLKPPLASFAEPS
jgi:tRNA nucleotidyltransferase (CCA-adding enzyme)